MPKSVDQLLEEARARLERVTAERAWAELSAGDAILVDTRTSERRAEADEIGRVEAWRGAGLQLVRGPATDP